MLRLWFLNIVFFEKELNIFREIIDVKFDVYYKVSLYFVKIKVIKLLKNSWGNVKKI